MAVYEHAGAVVEEILKADDHQKILACCLLWRCWIRRNKINAGEKAPTIAEVISQTRYWAKESELLLSQGRTADVQKVEKKWQRPEGETIKINTDGAFSAEKCQGGWGFVARDAQGRVRGAGAGKIKYAGSAVQAEALACAEALQAAMEWGMVDFSIETDSLNLVSALKGTDFDLAPEGVLFRDIKSFIRLNFGTLEIDYAPRTCNKVAHQLAAYGARHELDRAIWVDTMPYDVMCVATSEFAVSG
jgi:ribonuclease HI